jgi:hypothetical protein
MNTTTVESGPEVDNQHELHEDRPALFRKLSIWDRFCLIWGGPRRWMLQTLWPTYVARQLSKRQGECISCGACCRMSWFCRHLEYKNGKSLCRKYNRKRLLVCHVFPVNQSDLNDRNRVAPGRPCGFSFPED